MQEQFKFTGDLIQQCNAWDALTKGKEYESLFHEWHQKRYAEQALQYYQMAVTNGNSSAQSYCQNMEKILHRCNQIQDALNHWENGDCLSHHEMYLIGQNFLNGLLCYKNPKQGMLWIWDSAVHGNSQAQYEIGKYLSRFKNETFKQEGATFLKRAAGLGHADAQLELGTLYEKGLCGLPVDYSQAKKWFEMAKSNGSAMADFHLRRLNQCKTN